MFNILALVSWFGLFILFIVYRYKAQINNLNATISSIESEYTILQLAKDNIWSSLKKLVNDYNSLSDEIEDLDKRHIKTTANCSYHKVKSAERLEKIRELREVIKEFKDSIKKINKDNTNNVKELNWKITLLNNEIKQMNKETSKVNKKLKWKK